MAPIAIAARAGSVNRSGSGVRQLLGVSVPVSQPEPAWSGIEETKADRIAKHQPGEIEKAVRRMPTLYVIAFFGVVVLCAVLIIWNTLQVNKLTAERVKLDDQIAQTEQRLIRQRAEEMQLSAPDRVRAIAQSKLGMVEATGEDIIVTKEGAASRTP